MYDRLERVGVLLAEARRKAGELPERKIGDAASLALEAIDELTAEIREMQARMNRQETATFQEANAASCLANGMKPD